MKSNITLTPVKVPFLEGGQSSNCLKTMDYSFTHSELDSIQRLIVLALDAIEEFKENAISAREYLWEYCDPEDTSTLSDFKKMNKLKDSIRATNKKKKQFENIIWKIKKQKKSLN